GRGVDDLGVYSGTSRPSPARADAAAIPGWSGSGATHPRADPHPGRIYRLYGQCPLGGGGGRCGCLPALLSVDAHTAASVRAPATPDLDAGRVAGHQPHGHRYDRRGGAPDAARGGPGPPHRHGSRGHGGGHGALAPQPLATPHRRRGPWRSLWLSGSNGEIMYAKPSSLLSFMLDCGNSTGAHAHARLSSIAASRDSSRWKMSRLLTSYLHMS